MAGCVRAYATARSVLFATVLLIHLAGSVHASAQEVKIEKIERTRELPTPGAAVAVAWSADGEKLAAASNYGGLITVWDRNDTMISRFERRGDGPALHGSLVFTKSGEQLVFMPQVYDKDDVALETYDTLTGKVVERVPGPEPTLDYAQNRPAHFVMLPDHQTLLAGNFGAKKNLVAYRTKDWRILYSSHLVGGVFSLCVFGEGRLAAAGSGDDGVVIFDPATGALIKMLHPYQPSSHGTEVISSIAGSPDGKFLLVGVGLELQSQGSSSDIDGWIRSIDPVRVFRVEDGLLIATLEEPAPPIRRVAWDPKGRYVAVLDSLANLYLLLTDSGFKNSQKLKVGGPSMSLAISPSGNDIAIASAGGVVLYKISLAPIEQKAASP